MGYLYDYGPRLRQALDATDGEMVPMRRAFLEQLWKELDAYHDELLRMDKRLADALDRNHDGLPRHSVWPPGLIGPGAKDPGREDSP